MLHIAADPRRRTMLAALLLVLLVAGSALLVGGCAALRRAAVYPSADVEGLAIEEIDASAMTVRIDLAVTNPYGASLPVTGLDIALASEGQRFFEGEAAVDEAIPANETRTVPVPVRVPWMQLIQVLGTVHPGAELNLEADLGLTLRTPVVGDVRLPLKESRTVTVPSFR